ncbi:MAG: ATP-binding protein [Trueperaceae bacterium]
MSFELLVGPPGSGKTALLLERARELTVRGARVWWTGLPGQRACFYRRATEGGALLGLEFQTLQQVYYRLLAHARSLKPLVVGTGRLALVGEALARELGAPPSPGEARLFAGAIAEAKRFGLGIADIPAGDSEVERFSGVYAHYERLKGEAWDYDDFRREAVALAEAGGGPTEALVEADALMVDGLRELGPLDLRLLRALSAGCEVWLALPEAPPGLTPTLLLPARECPPTEVFEAPNPVSESRWVLRSLKRDLAAGTDPLDLAVIMPEGESVAFAALADEYGVPVMDERPGSLADTVPGRILLELLELPEYPTASRLLPIRELAPLASAALDAGVAGHYALALLAEQHGLTDSWRTWLARLEVPEDRDAWARSLVDQALAMAGEAGQGGVMSGELFRAHALARAKEAGRVAAGAGFRPWWVALLKEASLPARVRGGVALLDERLASGRRYRRAYLMRAVEGAYGVGEREDYFFPEERRVALASLFADEKARLPRRFEGRDRLLFVELRAVADELVVTYPLADQGGPLLYEPALVAEATPRPLPDVPAGSRLELADGERYRPLLSAQPLGEASLEDLRRYDECAMRFWLERRLDTAEARERGRESGERQWRALLSELGRKPELTPDRLESLALHHAWAAGWLAAHRQLLLTLRFGLLLPDGGDGPRALLDAAGRQGSEATFYNFRAPGSVASREDAEAWLDERWSELWAAGHMLERYRGRIERVRLIVWPILGEPIEAYPGGIRYPWKRIVSRRKRAEAALARFYAGSIAPSPGFRCRACPVRDVCREAVE